jgi:hypothetical protein
MGLIRPRKSNPHFMKGFASNEVSVSICYYVLDSLLVIIEFLILYFGLKSRPKYIKTNT